MEKRIKRETMDDLPEEIIEEILFKLPVKSLLRFKCVSKGWRRTTSSEEFIKHHMKKTSNMKVIVATFPIDIRRSCSLGSLLLDRNSINIASLDIHPVGHFLTLCPESTEGEYSTNRNLDSEGRRLTILGSCNGLMLITVNWKDLIVWNPSTGEAKSIVRSVGGMTRERGYFVYGFGYDECTNDYKVVSVFSSDTCRHTEMYSSRTNSWKKIENYHKDFKYCYSGKFVKGSLHWMAAGIDEGCYGSWEIVSLNLVEEKYRTWAAPKHFHKYCFQPTVENLGGYLSVIGYDNEIEVWVMTKYGEAESWTKFWSVNECLSFKDYFDHSQLVIPLWVTENGDMVVAYGPYVFVFNRKYEELSVSRLEIPKVKAGNYYVMPEIHIGPYVLAESLVSPFGDEQLYPQRSSDMEQTNYTAADAVCIS